MRAVAWSPDGTCLATTGDDDGIRLWNALTGEQMVTIIALAGGGSVAMDGRRFKLDDRVPGDLWWAIGLCRFEPSELDGLLSGLERVPLDKPMLEPPG